MAHGALLETIRIAASGSGLGATWTVEADTDLRNPRYTVRFSASTATQCNPLFSFIEKRVVQRRPMQTTPLTGEQRAALVASVGDGFQLQLFESFQLRRAIAGLLWHNAHIRLTCPEAFPVHKEIIEWGAQFSKDRIPERAVGIDPMTGKLMRWAMQSWGRVKFLNTYLMGTIPPRIQLDYLPALQCAAHLLIRPKKSLSTLEDWVGLGQAMQRLWLTVTQQGLHLQPEMTPVIFRWYARAGRHFSADHAFLESALSLSARFEQLAGASQQDAFGFFCRVGVSAVPRSRSTRKSLSELSY